MLNSAARSISLVLLTGCATALPDSLHVASDTGGLMAPSGTCDGRTTLVGAAPIERVELDLDCAGPVVDGQVKLCSEASLSMRDSMSGLIHLKGLTELEIHVDLPAKATGYAIVTVTPKEGEAELSDGAVPVLRFEVPAMAADNSLQVVPEGSEQSCLQADSCAFMALEAILENDGQDAQQYPLGTAASGVFLLDGIGWGEDPIALKLEVPFFAPKSSDATVCEDGLIHYIPGD